MSLSHSNSRINAVSTWKQADNVGQEYSTVAANLIRFNELQAMPMPIDIRRLDESKGIEATMLEHLAKWHKSCKAKFNKFKLERAEKRYSVKDSDPSLGASKKYRQSAPQKALTKYVCFFYGDGDTVDTLHEAATFGLNQKVTKCATNLQYQQLLAKLSDEDLVAQDAKYHLGCLVSLYNRAAADQSRKGKKNTTDNHSRSVALAELLTYIGESRMDEDVAPVLKLADLVKQYSAWLQQFGIEQDTRPLTLNIIAHFPDLKAYKEGRDVLLAFDKDIRAALRKLCKEDFDDEAICLARAAKIVRKDMFQLQAQFTGSFDEACKVNSVPQSLLTIVAMILDGPNIQSQSQSSSGTHQASLSVAQLLQYNRLATGHWLGGGSCPGQGGICRHSRPLFEGLSYHKN